MQENKLPNAPSFDSTNGPIAGISTHKDTCPTGSQSTNKSYPESEPCAPIASGGKLSYKTGGSAGTDGHLY